MTSGTVIARKARRLRFKELARDQGNYTDARFDPPAHRVRKATPVRSTLGLSLCGLVLLLDSVPLLSWEWQVIQWGRACYTSFQNQSGALYGTLQAIGFFFICLLGCALAAGVVGLMAAALSTATGKRNGLKPGLMGTATVAGVSSLLLYRGREMLDFVPLWVACVAVNSLAFLYLLKRLRDLPKDS